MNKIRVGVIFGGTNTEHEVSLVSARAIIDKLDPKKYDVLPIKITKSNQWQVLPQLTSSQKQLSQNSAKGSFLATATNVIDDSQLDVIFPVLHGPYGEDGTIQGMLEMMRLPYVGCNVLSSALCMDKVMQKQLCHSQNIPVPDFTWFTKKDWSLDSAQILKNIEAKLGYPCFVKPANQGSSVGVSKTNSSKELAKAINEALNYDLKIIVEEAIPSAREIECSVLGNDDPEASVLGEIVPSNEFYDYDAKYVDGKTEEIIPAKLPEKLSQKIRGTATKAFKLLGCSGLARIDFLLEKDTNNFYLNELNTMPGFTSISMYPKLWQASGLSYPKLLDKLINLALEKYQDKQSISLSFTPKKDWFK